ncbi:MAG: polyphosphate polymerase domain-containing protein [Thermoleophilia bacterium]|nr:polyphosphate polymerase domain-containing protein [Thermoleophilia bacterium]
MRAELSALDAYGPISLDELEATAGMLTRIDRKYLVTWTVAEQLLTALAPTHRALEIDGRRVFTYRSMYLDSPSLGAFRAHTQQRRRRYKCRTRHYVDADLHMFEVKLKGLRGLTIKHRLAMPGAAPTDEALSFATDCVEQAYGCRPRDLRECLTTEYRRVTLAGPASRMTLDFELHFRDVAGRSAALQDGYVIVESKTARGPGAADLMLKRLGVRPVECSKYCVGVALLRGDVKGNGLRWLIRRYFTPATLEPAHA